MGRHVATRLAPLALSLALILPAVPVGSTEAATWLPGYGAMRDGTLTTQRQVGMVGARGLDPTIRVQGCPPATDR